LIFSTKAAHFRLIPLKDRLCRSDTGRIGGTTLRLRIFEASDE